MSSSLTIRGTIKLYDDNSNNNLNDYDDDANGNDADDDDHNDNDVQDRLPKLISSLKLAVK